MFLTSSAWVAVAAILVAAPVAAADGAAASTPIESPLGTGRVDVAAISFVDATVRLGSGDGTGQPRDPESLVYTTTWSGDGVEVGWDTSGIGTGEVFGDTVDLRLHAADGPAEFRAEPLRLPAGDQGTTTWLFPEPGRYTLTFAVDANLLTGEPVSTRERYTVDVRAEQAGTPVSPAPITPPSVAPAPLAAQPAPTTPGRIVLDDGHVDAVAPRLLDGELQLQVKDGVTVGQAGGRVHWREPGDVTFHVTPAAKTVLPDDPALSFLGTPGAEIFLLPQQQQPGILWTGWSTEELRADQVRGPVTWRVTKVDGPGGFGVFTTGSFGDSTVIFNNTGSHSVPLGTHAHANWGFATPGVYRLTFDVTATLTGGQTVSDTEIYTFAVGAVGTVEPDDGTQGGSSGGGRTPGLADTGAKGVLPLTAGGVVLLGLGGVAVLVGRRKRENT